MHIFRMALRYVLFFIGITIMALGISLTTKADLGTTPISALPYVASMGFHASIGFFTGLLNLILVAAQIVVMGRNFPKLQYLQIPATFCFAFFIDVWMRCLPDFHDETYGVKATVLILGTIALAVGVFIEVSANVVFMAGEGAVKMLCHLLQRDFGVLKTFFDITLVAAGAILSLLLFHELKGVGIGTVVSAVFVGFCVKTLHSLRRRLSPAALTPR